MQAKGYRLRMPTWRRALLTGLLAGIACSSCPASWRPDCSCGGGVECDRLVTASPVCASCWFRSAYSRRGLRMQRNLAVPAGHPLVSHPADRRDRGSGTLEIELNSGERLALPCVENLDDLYHRMEHHRQALDA
jgi:hypothetical protein